MFMADPVGPPLSYRLSSIWRIGGPSNNASGMEDHPNYIYHVGLQAHMVKQPREDVKLSLEPLRLGG